jgi:hypothetical protein
VVVRVEHLRDALDLDLLLHGALVVSAVEQLKVEVA